VRLSTTADVVVFFSWGEPPFVEATLSSIGGGNTGRRVFELIISWDVVFVSCYNIGILTMKKFGLVLGEKWGLYQKKWDNKNPLYAAGFL
jgi:hypothetical protein